MDFPLNTWNASDVSAVRKQLERILKSVPFVQSRRRQRFLEYVVTETLAGRGQRLKGYNVALEVFDRPETFDPLIDPIVRIEAGRLREKLREYYDADGQYDPIRIELPKGGYTPTIEFRRTAPSELQPVTADDGQAQASAQVVINWRLIASVAALGLALILSGAWQARSPSLHGKPSIAVLPFDNIGDDPKWGRFADGITEDIITDLAHSKDLIVIARNSTRAYKGKPIDVRQIGRDLAVKYVLEGSIQSIGQRIRVTAQLIEAASGSHVWSERYDRPADDLFAVQNDVTGKIAATLTGYEGAVADAERSLLRRKPPANLTAFDTYLLAMEAKHKVTKESFAQAEALFNKALERDPQLARAYVGLVDTQFYLIDLGLAPSVEEAVAKMTAAAEKAAALDPDDGKSHYALGLAYLYRGKTEQASSEFARAEALAPSDADALLCIAWSIPMLGQSNHAVSLAERALMLNPHYPDWYNQGLSYVFFFGEQYERSIKYRRLVKKPLALDYAYLAMANAYLGRAGDAEAAVAKVKELDGSWIAERYLSEAGGGPEREGELIVNGARKAGLPACVPSEKMKDMPNLIRVKSCDPQRGKIAG